MGDDKVYLMQTSSCMAVGIMKDERGGRIVRVGLDGGNLGMWSEMKIDTLDQEGNATEYPTCYPSYIGTSPGRRSIDRHDEDRDALFHDEGIQNNKWSRQFLKYL